jgi:uncharacterized OsmC-like protein
MYAERKKWPLDEVRVELSYAKVHAEDCANCDTEVRMIDQIALNIVFAGSLSADQRARLMEIADKCPVHRTLTSQVRVRSQLVGELVGKGRQTHDHHLTGPDVPGSVPNRNGPEVGQ